MSHWYKTDEVAAIKAIETISNAITNNVIVVDVGAGKSDKSLNLLSSFVKNHPSRKIFYIPIDVSDVILDWPTYIKDFDIAKNVVGVKPIVCDAVEAIDNLRSGFLVLTFIELSPKTQTQWDKCLYLSNTPKHLESVLLGLKVIGESDFDTSNFKYSHEYADYFSSLRCQGYWSGCIQYAQAKKDITITFNHSDLLDTQLILKEGEKLRFSVETTTSQFFETQYLASFANVNDLGVGGISPGDDEFGIASILYKCKD